MALALVIGLGASAQNTMWDRGSDNVFGDMFDWEALEDGSSRMGMFDWDNSVGDYFDGSSFGMFDMSIFTDLLDWSAGVEAVNDWVSEFELFDNIESIDIPGLPNHGMTDNVDAPLGSGIVVLLGLGAAYGFAKRRKEE